jgi:hypothetical protein
MILTPGTKQSQMIAAGLLGLIVLVVFVILGAPIYLAHSHYDGPIEQLIRDQQKYQQILDSRSDVLAKLDNIRNLQGRNHFLKETDSSLAASEIQNIANLTIRQNRGRIESVSILPAEEDDDDEVREPYQQIIISIRFITKMTGFRNIIYTLETMQPYLVIDNLDMRSGARSNYVPAPGNEPDLIVSFDLIGFMQRGDKQ